MKLREWEKKILKDINKINKLGKTKTIYYGNGEFGKTVIMPDKSEYFILYTKADN
jgi:hypothetical protein